MWVIRIAEGIAAIGAAILILLNLLAMYKAWRYRNIQHKWVVLVGFLLLAESVSATTYTCGITSVNNSCTVSGMNTLIGGTQNGDKITIAVAVHDMSSGMITINKRIEIDGGGTCTGCGTNSPSWSGGAELQFGTDTRLTINAPAGTGHVRIHGLHITGGPSFTYNNYDATTNAVFYVALSSNRADYRVDNNWFDSTTAHSGGILNSPGLMDHNIFQAAQIEGHMFLLVDSHYDIYGVASYNDQLDNGGGGGYEWAQPTNWGGGLSDRWYFFEDNTFIRPSGAVSFESSAIDMISGARYVARRNYFRNAWVLNHDKSFGGFAGSGIAADVYDNTFNFESSASFQSAMLWRDGSMLYHGNDHVGFWQAYVKFRNRRYPTADGPVGSWGDCDGTKVWDENAGPSGYHCAQQVGTLKTAAPGHSSIQPQELFATRLWSNTGSVTSACSGTSQHSGKVCNDHATTIVDNTDYIMSDDASAALGGYSPYTYPHPLVGANEDSGVTILGAARMLEVAVTVVGLGWHFRRAILMSCIATTAFLASSWSFAIPFASKAVCMAKQTAAQAILVCIQKKER